MLSLNYVEGNVLRMRRDKYTLFLMFLLGILTLSVTLNTGGSHRNNKINEIGFILKDGSITYTTWNYKSSIDLSDQATNIRNHSSLVKVNITSISNETLKIEVNIESHLEEAFIIYPDSTQADPFGYNITMYPNNLIFYDPELSWQGYFILPNETSKMKFVYFVETQKLEDLMKINLFTGSLVIKYKPLNETGGWECHESCFAFEYDKPKSFIEINAKTWEMGDELFFDWARNVGWTQLHLESYTVTDTGEYQGFDTWILEALDEPYESKTKSFYNIAEYEKHSGILIKHDLKEILEEEGDYRIERQSHIWISNINLPFVPTTSSTTTSKVTVSSITSWPSLNFLLGILGMILIYRFIRFKR